MPNHVKIMPALTHMHPGNPHGLRFNEGDTGETGTATGETAPPPGRQEAVPARLPDDHPLVTAYSTVKQESTQQRAQIQQMEADHQAALQAATQRAEAAEAEAAQIDTRVTESLRIHLATVHQITDEDRDLYLTAQDPDTLLRQVQGLVARGGKGAGYVPTQGTASPSEAKVSSYELGRERAKARLNNQNTAP